MWEVLGIARTTDKVAIRRAYAAKLRSIDSDRDPAAFIQVRQAYEAALAWSNRPKPRMTAVVERAKAAEAKLPSETPPVTAPDIAPDPAPVRPPVAVKSTPASLKWDAEESASFAEFQYAIGERRTRDAARVLDRIMARGLVELGAGYLMLYRLAEIAVQDFSLSADEFATLIRKLGYADVPPGSDFTTELRRQVGYRLTADAWIQTLQTMAGTWALGNGHDDMLIAQLFLGQRALWRGVPGLKNGRMLRFIEEYQRHRPWMSHPLDAGRMERIEARYRKKFRRWKRREAAFVVLVVAFVVFMLIRLVWLLITGHVE